MKTPAQVLVAIGKRVAAGWHLDIASAGDANWPHSFAIGAVTKPELEADFIFFQRLAQQWREWADTHGLTLGTTSRRVQGTTQVIPTHLTIPSLQAAVELLGPAWKERIEQGRTRLAKLRESFREVPDLPRVVREVDSYSSADFELLCSAAVWFKSNSASGLTPRQVPIEGLHAKWLNARTHRLLIQQLAGIASLDLLPPHPQRIHFTYLDPDHLAEGHRQHDSATVGDRMIPAYIPEIVVISENKDTAIHFPPLRKGVSIEGVGYSGAEAIATFDWITQAPLIIYWGDMDPSGFEIVNRFRQTGLRAHTILMDLQTFEVYECFGATTDARGNPLGIPPRKRLPHLTDTERALYDRLTDPAWPRVRRVEQERIPLAAALDAVEKEAVRE